MKTFALTMLLAMAGKECAALNKYIDNGDSWAVNPVHKNRACKLGLSQGPIDLKTDLPAAKEETF